MGTSVSPWAAAAQPHTNERFASGRIAFNFDLLGTSGTEIPTTTMRSRSDVDAARGPSDNAMVLAGKDAAVLEAGACTRPLFSST